jgi:hypothetical protein
MLVGVAAVAGAMYVAAASGSQRSTGPTAKQFKALRTQVTVLSKKLKATQNDLDGLTTAYLHCSLPSELGISQFTVGNLAGPYHATAVDLTNVNPGWELTPYNPGDPACQSLVGAAALRHEAAKVIAQKFSKNS